jgi:intracellular multiplication protein IcmV
MVKKADKSEKQRGKVRRALAWTFKPMVDVKSWVGVETLKENTQQLSSVAKNVFTPKTAKRKETFEGAMRRLRLTEKDLKEQEKNLSLQLFFYLLMATGVLCYALYLLLFGVLTAFLLALVVCGLILAQAFRAHFWMFQIKHRKLGCEISEWYHAKRGGEKNGN